VPDRPAPPGPAGHLAEAAGAAEELRREYGDIVLNAGCEWTVFSDGTIPGRGYGERAAKLARPQWWPAPPVFSHRLNRLLAWACQIARGEFADPLSHAPGHGSGWIGGRST
jgi:hypothetical protein